MKISVVIIAYNLQEFIEDSIKSVLNQTRKADEIIVIDDCSTDSTPLLIKRYASSVQYYSLAQNSGALIAALEGVKHASGDIICMLDGDDTWALNKLAVVEKEFASQSELILLSHHHVRTDSKGKKINIKDETHVNISRVVAKSSSQEDLSNYLKDTILAQKGYWLGSAYSFRRDAFDISHFTKQLGLFNKGDIKDTYLDLIIAPYLVLTNPKKLVGFTGETYFNYRIHSSGSLSNNFTVEKALRSLRKGKTVNELILHILVSNGAASNYITHRNILLQEYSFIENLYKKNFWVALRSYLFLSKRLWTRRRSFKELSRLLGVLVLTPDRFLRLKHKRAFK